MFDYTLYQSQSHDPFLNLAIEDWLLRASQFQDQAILFFYVNNPAVVIGRAQNPWVECDLALAEKKGIPLVRRQSGGGTVYHDLGNLNFSFIVPKAMYDKAKHIQLIRDLLQQAGMTTHTNERHDIRVMHNSTDYKISGSAFRETKDRAFHHGTLLFDGDLKSLSPLLNPQEHGIEAKGVKSVRSPVINLQDIYPTTSIDPFLQTVETVLQQPFHPITDGAAHDNPYIQTVVKTYQSWDWCFGKTLPFSQRKTVNGREVEIQVQHGLVDGKPFTL